MIPCKNCGGNMKYENVFIPVIEEYDEWYECECGRKISLIEAEDEQDELL